MTSLYNEKIIEELCVANHVVSAEDGKEALSFLESTKKNRAQPELILVDIYMPTMNGWEFIEQCQKQNLIAEKSTAVVVLTSSRNPEDEKHARTLPGVIGFLTKPLSEPALMEVIKQHFADVVPMR
jgi:CheY-like chemotaxis protein